MNCPLTIRFSFVALVAVLGGCSPDVSTCDIEAARGPLYYDDNGFPAYPGQALVELNCGRARFCHSAAAIGEDRLGAPIGLELDIGVIDPDAADPAAELARIAHARRVAYGMRVSILASVDSGSMPPAPPSGVAGLDTPLRYRAFIGTTEEHEVPPLGSPAGREILRNWLACGAHVIEATAGESTGIGDIAPRARLCPDGEADCDGSGTCIPISSDPLNCGGCGVRCGSNQACVERVCTCTTGLTPCGGVCVDTQTDGLNCGACGMMCPAFCAAGGCVDTCPPEFTCGASCVDTQTSSANCGGCGVVCPVGARCSAGACSCESTLTACSGACVDTDTDPANCGDCGTTCRAGEVCNAGSCGCRSGLTDCGGTCVDTSSDPANCGTCGMNCGAASCVGSACVSCGTAVSFARDVFPIFRASCLDSGCHGGARAAANLRLDSVESAWSELVNVPASCGGNPLVRPGVVAESYLMNKLTDVGICSGTLMPKRGESLAPSEIDVIRAWICDGAAND